MNFSEFDFTDELMEGLEAMRFKEATPIQEKAIPIIKKGNDLIACAQTGTGKTAAYLLPVLDKLIRNKTEGITTLILVPTRELALQIDQQLEGFSYFLPFTSISVFGGNDKSLWEQQKKALTTGADFIVATPGRMMQHLNMGYVVIDTLQHFILDEADRMLDMGFYDDITQIESYLPKKRQNLLFSATMPHKIRDLAKALLTDPEEVNIALSKPAEGILQAAYVVYEPQKDNIIVDLLRDKDMQSIIIFVSRKVKVNTLTSMLVCNKFNAKAIHSDLDQNERIEVLRQFKNRNVQILVATDIVARGIDIENIDLVINYDVPSDAADYVHRIGRTARAKSKGVGITFISEDDQYNFGQIEKLIESDIYKIPVLPDYGEAPVYDPNKRVKQGGRGAVRKGGGKFKKRFNGRKNKD